MKSRKSVKARAKSGFISAIATDKRVISLRNRLKKSAFDTEAAIAELRSMHSSRSIRSIKRDAVLQSATTTLVEAVLQNQSFRSRAVEIKTEAMRVSYPLYETIDHLRKYIRAYYQSDLLSSYPTATDRKEAIEHVLTFATREADSIEFVCTFADEIIADMDEAGWAVKRIGDMLQLQQQDRA